MKDIMRLKSRKLSKTAIFAALAILLTPSVWAADARSQPLILHGELTGPERPDPPAFDGDSGHLVSIDQAVKKACETNERVKVAVERLEKEKALYKAKRAEFFPQVKTEIFQAFATGEKNSLTYFDTSLEQPLFQGGKALALKRKQKTIVETEELKFAQAKLDLELDLRIIYTGLLARKELTRITQGEVKELTRAFGQTRSLFEKELLRRQELLRVESLLGEAQHSLVEHKEAYDYLLEVLKETLGIEEGESLDLEPLGEITGLTEDLSGYLALARKRDPFYRITGMRVKEKEFEKKALQAERLPHLSLAARWNLYRDIFVDTDRAMLGVVGKWNIWDFGRTQSEIKAKEHEIEEMKWTGEIEIRQKEDEIRRLFHTARAAHEKIRLEKTRVEEREEFYKNEKAKLIAGAKGAAEFLDSYIALEEAKKAWIQAVTDYRVLITRLERNSGFKYESSETEGEKT